LLHFTTVNSMLTGKQIAVTGAVLCSIAVAGGAFGAHALKAAVTPDRLETYKTAIAYMQWHSFGVLLMGYLYSRAGDVYFRNAAVLMLLGIIFFSGSLVVLVLTGKAFLGAVAPVGGVLFISSWIYAAIGLNKHLAQ
jgi:uncharacterized membrane protein YgdD (TMEM256/DUF423 family)